MRRTLLIAAGIIAAGTGVMSMAAALVFVLARDSSVDDEMRKAIAEEERFEQRREEILISFPAERRAKIVATRAKMMQTTNPASYSADEIKYIFDEPELNDVLSQIMARKIANKSELYLEYRRVLATYKTVDKETDRRLPLLWIKYVRGEDEQRALIKLCRDISARGLVQAEKDFDSDQAFRFTWHRIYNP